MKNNTNKIEPRRIACYWFTGIVLSISYIFLRDLNWRGSEQLHTLMEVAATLLALMVGAMALVRFYSKKNNLQFYDRCSQFHGGKWIHFSRCQCNIC